MVPVPQLKCTEGVNLEGFYVPLMWADENGEVTTSLANQYKDSVRPTAAHSPL